MSPATSIDSTVNVPPLPRASWLALGCAWATCVIAVADLAIWRMVYAGWTPPPTIIPMAPSTALLYLLLGGALVLNAHLPGRMWVRKFVLGAAGFTILMVSFVFFYLLNDRVPAWDYWLGAAGAKVHGYQAGRMSLYTGGMITLSLIGLILQVFGSRRNAHVQGAGALISILAGYVGLLSVTARLSGVPLLVSVGLGVLSTVSAIALTVFNAAVLASGDTTGLLRHWFFGAEKTESDYAAPSREERWVLGSLAGLGALTLIAGVVYLRNEAETYRTRSIAELQSLTELKAGRIEQWRKERMGDARSFMGMPGLGNNVSALSAPGQAAQRALFIAWLRHYIQNYDYANIVVFGATMKPVLSEPNADLSAIRLPQQLSRLEPDSDVIELPPYVDGAGRLHWDLLVPLPANNTAKLEGAILLQSDLSRSVIPILQSWSGQYQTGQSMLWHREGDRLISLGGYRPVPGTTPDELRPFGMTRSISDPRSQSMLTRVVRGELSAGEDRDHRGVTIVGLGRAIPRSPWFLSSRVDAIEVYGPLRKQMIGVASACLALLAVAGLTTSWLWRQRQRNLVNERVAAELDQKRTAARLGVVMRHANDIILLADEQKRFVDANQRAVDTYGWTKEELFQMTLPELRAPEIGSAMRGVYERANTAEGFIFESIHRRKDGTTFPVEISARQVEIDGRPQLLSIVRDVSDRRQAEAQLRSSEEKFSKAFQANPSGIALTDLASGRFIEINESYCRIMGFSPKDLIGRTSLELGIWGRGEDRSQMFKPLFQGGSLRDFEMQVRTRAGEPRTVLVNAELIELNGQRCVLSLIEDITDRRQAEVALRASEERYRLIADNTSDVIWLYDLASETFTYVSPSVHTLRGFRAEEVLGQKLTTSLTPASAEKVLQLLNHELAEIAAGDLPRRPVVVEVDQILKGGGIVPTEVVASVLSDATRRPTQVLGISRDITERLRARQALEKFNEELDGQVKSRTAELARRNREIEALVASIPDTVLLCDERGDLVTSHFAQSGTSFPSANSGGGDALSRESPVLLEIARELHTVAWASQESIMMEFDRTIDGVACSIEARATPAGDNRLLILLRDISARKRSERVAQANLERERQLAEMKSQFVTVASHEFRTPLAAAVGSLELLERHADKLNEVKKGELLGRVRNSLDRLTDIMNNVLQLSRADSGRLKVKLMDVDLGRFAQEVVNDVAEGDRHAHTFSFQQSGGLGTVPVDTNLLNHILSNLVGNAARYSPAGTKVEVSLVIDEQAYALTIADQGIGIPETERDHIFEPFARGSNVGNIGGTGLGLNIVKRYTELLGGRIEVLPSARGATFRVRVPFSPAAPSS